MTVHSGAGRRATAQEQLQGACLGNGAAPRTDGDTRSCTCSGQGSLVAQQSGCQAFTATAQVQSLFGELRSRKPHCMCIHMNVCVCVCVCVCVYIYTHEHTHTHTHTEGFPGGSVGKKNLPTIQETSCNAGDPGLILGWGRSPGEGNVNPHQNSCLENSMDRGAWWPKVHGISRVGHDLVTNHHTRTHTSIYLYRQIQQ